MCDSIVHESILELNGKINELSESLTSSTNMNRNDTNNCNFDDCFLSYEEVMSVLFSPTDAVESTSREVNVNTVDTSLIKY